jgi:hypothetical protein
MAQDDDQPVEDPDGPPASDGRKWTKEPLNLPNFLLVASAVLTVVIALLVARFTELNTWTIVLVSTGVLLALGVMFTRLTETKWFYPVASWAAIFALIAFGVYVADQGRQQRPPPGTGMVTINSPVNGDVTHQDSYSGNVSNLGQGQLVWTFNQPVDTNGPSEQVYPNSGPCPVDYSSHTWKLIQNSV